MPAWGDAAGSSDAAKNLQSLKISLTPNSGEVAQVAVAHETSKPTSGLEQAVWRVD